MKIILNILILTGWLIFLGIHLPCYAQQNNPAKKSVNTDNYADRYVSQQHFDDWYDGAAMQFQFQGKTKKDVELWQKAFLPRLKQALGLFKIEASLKGYRPRAEKKYSEDAGFCIREQWIIWTEPTVPLPVVALIPKDRKGKLPLVITPHGHGSNSFLYTGIFPNTTEQPDENKKDRIVAVQGVKEGYIVIAPTTRAFGDTRSEKDKLDSVSFSCHRQLMHDLLLGRTPIGDRVWDMSRIIDWAIKNLPVDESKIAITGNSGGGTVSLFAAACDARIAVAAPSSYFCTFKGSIGTIDHCDCNYIPGILDLGEMSDVAGLIAPRPLRLINGVEDKVFPIEETRKSFFLLKKIYAADEAEDKASLYEGAGGHRYYSEGSWPFIKDSFDAIR